MKNIKIITIIIIILAASFLRLWKLDSYPALNADEAAIGYTAYSLLETGKDEHGNSWPIHFQSFDDYKPGLYFYLVLPFVKILGLNEWSVRLPNALLAIVSVWLIYLLVKQFKNRNLLKIGKCPPRTEWFWGKLEIIAPALLAVSPWHIHFSRGGWEVNTATFFILLGLVFFLKSKNNIIFLFLSFFVFSLSVYTYHAARIITPLMIFGLLVIFWCDVRKNPRHFLLAGLLFIIFLLPLGYEFTKPQILSRAGGVGLFADTGPIERTNEQRMEHTNLDSKFSIIIHNKLINYGLTFAKNWIDHYHGLFLFVSGDDIQRDKVPETGQMYLFEILTVVVGLFYLFKNHNQSAKTYTLILYWLIIAPIPAALTFQSPHALRSQNMVIPLTIISAIGLVEIMKFLTKLKHNYFFKSFSIFHLAFSIFILLNIFRHLHMYWTHMSKEYPYSSQYGVKELVEYLNGVDQKFEKVLVTDRYDQPYILFLFYKKYPPRLFQFNHTLLGRDRYGFSTVSEFDKYHFKSIYWDSDKLLYPNSLIIGTDEEIPDEANIIKKIYGSNGYHYFDIVAN